MSTNAPFVSSGALTTSRRCCATEIPTEISEPASEISAAQSRPWNAIAAVAPKLERAGKSPPEPNRPSLAPAASAEFLTGAPPRKASVSWGGSYNLGESEWARNPRENWPPATDDPCEYDAGEQHTCDMAPLLDDLHLFDPHLDFPAHDPAALSRAPPPKKIPREATVPQALVPSWMK
jgi:hypothetical protein